MQAGGRKRVALIGGRLAAMCGLIALCVATGIAEEGSAPLRHEIVVDAPVGDVWNAFTTAEGLRSWMAPHAEVDLRVGGKMRSNYDPAGSVDDENAIENTILSLEPHRMLSMRCTKAPANFPFKAAIANMWSVVSFDEIGPDRTRVRIAGMGFGADEESEQMRAFFDKGNAFTLKKLREKFARPDAESQTAPVEKLVKSLAGEWTFRNERPDGSIFRGRMVAREILGGHFVLCESWLGDADTLNPHGYTVFGRNPEGGGMRIWDFSETGGVAGGAIRLENGNRLLYDWNVQKIGGTSQRYCVEEVFEDADSLRFMLYLLKPEDRPGHKPAGGKAMVNVLWKRTGGGSGEKNEGAATR